MRIVVKTQSVPAIQLSFTTIITQPVNSLLPKPLSVYVLTFNSEKYLDILLSSIRSIADEIVIVDSGSQDQTRSIADRHGCHFVYRALDTFREQREFAMRTCQHQMVLMLDSDEIPDAEFVQHIIELKQTGFDCDAYQIKRNWFVMGQPVTCMYPVRSPDFTVRLVRQDRVTFISNECSLVHEKVIGYQTLGDIRGAVSHYTFESRQEMTRKLHAYSALAARDLVELGIRPGLVHVLFHPPIAWVKWYIVRGGWRDGRLGWTIGQYVWSSVFRKFSGARKLHRIAQTNTPSANRSPVAPLAP